MSADLELHRLKLSIQPSYWTGVVADYSSIEEYHLDHPRPIPECSYFEEDAFALKLAEAAPEERTMTKIEQALSSWKLLPEQRFFLTVLALADGREDA